MNLNHLGYRHDLERPATLAAEAMRFACSSASIPDEIDARPWVTTENQGPVSSCYGHASSTVGEHCNYIQTGGSKAQFSRMYCYLTGQQEAGLFGSDQGCFIDAGVRALKKRGFCLETTFPYPGRYVTSIPQAAFDEGSSHKIQSHTVISSLDELIQFNGRGIGGVIGGIPWYGSFANARDGLIDSLGGGMFGWHAVAFIGYDSSKRPRLFNSHGTGWGEGGSAVIARDVMEALFRIQGSIFIGVSDLEQFGDREIPTWRGVLSA